MDAETFNCRLGAVLRKLRKENSLTQDELGKRTGLSRGTIANMETGRQAMSAFQAYQIAAVLQLDSIDTLYPLTPDASDNEAVALYRPPDLSDSQRKQLETLMTRSAA